MPLIRVTVLEVSLNFPWQREVLGRLRGQFESTLRMNDECLDLDSPCNQGFIEGLALQRKITNQELLHQDLLCAMQNGLEGVQSHDTQV